MTKRIPKSVILMVVLGLLVGVASAPRVMAQDCPRPRHYNYYRRDHYRYDYYQDRQDTVGKAVGRTAAGAGIGAVAGALIGGGKGAAIGAAIGGAGGYIYHVHRVDEQKDRYYRRW